MSYQKEVQAVSDRCQAEGEKTLTAEYLVKAAKDGNTYPMLYAHLWSPSEAKLAAEARLARAHRLLITITVTVGEGVKTRLYWHTKGTKGYAKYEKILASKDLAQVKLDQLIEDIARARGRLRVFRALLPDSVAEEIDAALQAAEATARNASRRRDDKKPPEDGIRMPV